eukprot:1842328-Pyramimonas_sp.AAC.1
MSIARVGPCRALSAGRSVAAHQEARLQRGAAHGRCRARALRRREAFSSFILILLSGKLQRQRECHLQFTPLHALQG